MMNRARPAAPGYDTLAVDPLKYTLSSFPGQINNAEVYTPAQGANVIYRFDSQYDSASILGRMKNKPVGLEYMGNDFKSILLSFPLYYMDTNDARKFIHYVMKEKFVHPVGIGSTTKAGLPVFNIYPNPVTDECNVAFTLEKPALVRFTLSSLQGRVLRTWVNDLEGGFHSCQIPMAALSPGIYELVILYNEGKSIKKIIKSR
jgi:hypothetical protein